MKTLKKWKEISNWIWLLVKKCWTYVSSKKYLSSLRGGWGLYEVNYLQVILNWSFMTYQLANKRDEILPLPISRIAHLCNQFGHVFVLLNSFYDTFTSINFYQNKLNIVTFAQRFSSAWAPHSIADFWYAPVCNKVITHVYTKLSKPRGQQRDRSVFEWRCHLSTTFGGGFTLSLLMFNVKQGRCKVQFL